MLHAVQINSQELQIYLVYSQAVKRKLCLEVEGGGVLSASQHLFIQIQKGFKERKSKGQKNILLGKISLSY